MIKYLVVALAALGWAAASSDPDDDLKAIEIVAVDGSAKATFIPYGATLTSLWNGEFRDVSLGFDDPSLYKSTTPGLPHLGPIVGRYANRIRNGTFTIPIRKNAAGPGKKYYVPHNEGNNTLHGGKVGYDKRDYSVADHSQSSVTFTMIDPAGTEGFPGQVNTTVMYTLQTEATFAVRITATASEDTPLMLSAHYYWNLEAYKESEDLNSHYAQVHSSKYVVTDPYLIPTGQLGCVEDSPMDFRTGKSIGQTVLTTASAAYCGANCVGFDNCWVFDNVTLSKPAFSLWSTNSGIKVDVFTNQRGVQIYSCNHVNTNGTSPIPRKKSQGGPDKGYANHSCLSVEAEDLIDGINNPEFGVDQIYGPNRPYKSVSLYKFSTLKDDVCKAK